MAAAADTVLKILNGAQNGVEIVLEDGEYSIGKGPEDDLQFVDLALEEGHALLRLAAGKVALRAGTGPVATSTGLFVAPGAEEWHEIDQLDIVTVGATRFAVAGANANWGQLVAAAEPALDERPAPRQRKTGGGDFGFNMRTARRVALPAAALVGILWFGASTLASRDLTIGQLVQGREVSDAVAVRDALAGFDFLGGIDVVEEVDGSVEIRGYVESLVERRAIRNAVTATGVPATLRVWVLDAIRSEVDGLIDVRDMPVDYVLEDNGVLTLTGIVLDPARARGFLRLLEEQLIGVRSIVSQIRTAETILAEVTDLADRSALPGVLFRLDGLLVEATGAVASNNIENWIGFLQAYSNRFADIIPLRAIVSVEGTPEGRDPVPLLVGRATGAQSRGGRELPRELLDDAATDFDTVVAAVTGAPLPVVAAQEAPPAEETPAAETREEPGTAETAEGVPAPGATPTDTAGSATATAGEEAEGDAVPADADADAEAAVDAGGAASGTGPDPASPTSGVSLAADGGIERLVLGEATPRQGAEAEGRAARLAAELRDLAAAVGDRFERFLDLFPAGPQEVAVVEIVTDPEARRDFLSRAAETGSVDRERFDAAAERIRPLLPPAGEAEGDPVLAEALRSASSGTASAPGTAAQATTGTAAAIGATGTRATAIPRLGIPITEARRWLMEALTAAGLSFGEGLRALDGSDTLAAVERIITDDDARDAFLDRAGVTDPARRAAFARAVDEARDALGIAADETAVAEAGTTPAPAEDEAFAPVVISPEARTAFLRLTDATAALIEAFRAEDLVAVVGEDNAAVLAGAIETIAPSVTEAAAERASTPSESFLLPTRRRGAGASACWQGGRIAREMVPVVIFWLDLLSVSEALRLSDLTVENRGILIEAALSPERLSDCLERIGTERALALLEDSLYLLEARVNPGFVAFIVRGAATETLNIVGASLAGDRYVQLASGINLEEGAAPTRATRIASIGELGVLVRTTDGYNAAVYPPSLPWVLR